MDNNVKKNIQLVQQESDKLYGEIVKTGYDESLATIISSDMRSKGGYLFNKSHSFSYAVLCLQTAYLKAHYPVYFYKALLNLKKNDNGKLNKYITDALNNGISVIPPQINKSEVDFIVDNNKILFGLSSISGVGETSVLPIIDERNINGKYKSLDDLISRVPISDSQLVSLVKSGAIPCKSKRNLLIKYAQQYKVNNKEFSPLTSVPSPLSRLQQYGIDTDVIKNKEERLRLYNVAKEKEYIQNQLIKNEKIVKDFEEKYMQDEEMWEFETLSIFLSYNPFKDVAQYLTSYEEANDNTETTIVGVIANSVVKKNKRKQQYAYVTLCTAYGLVEVACWAFIYSQYNEVIKKGNRIAVLCNKQDEKYSVKELKSYNKWKMDRKIV